MLSDEDWKRPRKVASDGKPTSAKTKATRARPPATGSREVIVKVTGRTNSPAALRAQLSYITRKGTLIGEQPNGQTLTGMVAINDLHQQWLWDNAAFANRPNWPTQSVAVVLSMPQGTPMPVVQAAVRAWAAEHVAPHTDFLMAPHIDRNHPHYHVALRSVRYDGQRVHASPAEVQAWRRTFAHELNQHGVMALASPRHEIVERALALRQQLADVSMLEPPRQEPPRPRLRP